MQAAIDKKKKDEANKIAEAEAEALKEAAKAERKKKALEKEKEKEVEEKKKVKEKEIADKVLRSIFFILFYFEKKNIKFLY